MIALSMGTSLAALKRSEWVAERIMSWPRGSMMSSLAPRLAACLKYVAATGWLVVGRAPITMMQSALSASLKGAETAPEPTPSISAATEEAWQRRVQWSTLLVPNPWRTSFWNR